MGTFTEGIFESLSVELLRGGTHRKDVVGVFCRPPGRDKGGFSHEMAKVTGQLWANIRFLGEI